MNRMNIMTTMNNTGDGAVSFKLSPEVSGRTESYARLEHLSVEVFLRYLIEQGLKMYEYEGVAF